MASVVLSVVGSDRPGLTQAVADAVLAAGGNWLESHLSRLGGLYVGSVLVALRADQLEGLLAGVRAVDAEGLEVRVVPAADASAESSGRKDPLEAGETLQFSLVGQDRPGIVQQVTRVLSGLSVNIETFETRLSAEPHAGGQLFHLEARLRRPPGVPARAVQDALEAISGEIMVDIDFGAAPSR